MLACLQVKQRTLPKSFSCGKTFRNHTALHIITDVHHWLLKLAKELDERVTEDRKANARLPQLLTVSVYSPPQGADPKQASWPGGSSVSRSCQLRKATAACMADDATALVSSHTYRSMHAITSPRTGRDVRQNVLMSVRANQGQRILVVAPCHSLSTEGSTCQQWTAFIAADAPAV